MIRSSWSITSWRDMSALSSKNRSLCDVKDFDFCFRVALPLCFLSPSTCFSRVAPFNISEMFVLDCCLESVMVPALFSWIEGRVCIVFIDDWFAWCDPTSLTCNESFVALFWSWYHWQVGTVLTVVFSNEVTRARMFDSTTFDGVLMNVWNKSRLCILRATNDCRAEAWLPRLFGTNIKIWSGNEYNTKKLANILSTLLIDACLRLSLKKGGWLEKKGLLFKKRRMI